MAVFVVDAQLPPGLARRLRGLGHDAVHVYDQGLGAASDDALWRRLEPVVATVIEAFESGEPMIELG